MRERRRLDPIFTMALSVGGGVHHAANPDLFYAVWDDGQQITFGSGNPGSPAHVVNPGPELGVIWMKGRPPTVEGDAFDLSFDGIAA